jgi:dynactin complex subunit
METMTRSSWTDDRMDDLNVKVDQGFARVEADIRGSRTETRTESLSLRGEMKKEFAAVRQEMKQEFAAVRSEMKEGFERMDRRFERMDEHFYDLQKTNTRLGIGIIVTLIGAILSQQL